MTDDRLDVVYYGVRKTWQITQAHAPQTVTGQHFLHKVGNLLIVLWPPIQESRCMVIIDRVQLPFQFAVHYAICLGGAPHEEEPGGKP